MLGSVAKQFVRAAGAILLLGISVPAWAYDFDELTALANGTLQGDNVAEAVPGFEIRLLQEGQVIYHQSFGNWALDQPANIDSSTKTLSGALIMSVTDTGEMGFSLGNRLSDFLPEYDQTDLRDITIRQSFSHSSGMAGTDVGSAILKNENISLRQAAYLVSLKPLASTPGSTFAYGGLSMQAVGAVVEVVTGEGYIDLFTQRISTPLGMTNTQFVLASDSNPRVAGGIESTATDYARFMDMLLNDGVDRVSGTQVLSTAAVEEMLRRQTTDSQPIANSPVDNNRYGIGIWLDQLGQAGPSVEAMAGGARGFHSWIDSSEELAFTFATDTTTFGNVEVLSSLMHTAILKAVSLSGDYNFDGTVDAADYTVWRDAVGQTGLGIPADGNNDEMVDQGDFDIWKNHFGPEQEEALATALPEPSTLGLLFFAMASCCCAARR